MIVKLAVVAAVVAVASFSLRIVCRQFTAPPPDAAAAVAVAVADAVAGRRRLQWLVGIELVGIAVALVATVGLVASAPPRAVAAAPESVSVVQGQRIAQVVLDPPVAGGTTMHVYVSSVSGSLDQPKTMTVTATLAARDIVDLTVPLNVAGPGHLTSTDAVLPVPGAWQIMVTARYSEFDQVSFVVSVTVR